MAKGVPFVQITMLFMQAIFKYCAKYTIIYLLKEKELSIMYIQGGICMISFLVCLALLIGGYFVYGNLVNNIFSPDDRETPAVRINDGVDYVVMPQWKLFLIQLLNIAGLGPIFGAMQGALWGPIVFLWITFGTIFAGGVHDFFSGMMSERNDGASISEVCGIYLGGLMQNVMRVFSVVLLVMVGTVFAVGPAGLIVTLFSNGGAQGLVVNKEMWLWIILAYYFIATFISIDKIIGKIYPIFGICLIIMALGVAFGIFTKPEYVIPEIWSNFRNMHPSGTPIWSFMFITVACGAISGFHSLVSSGTTSKQLDKETDAKPIAYGGMLLECVLAVLTLCAIGYAYKWNAVHPDQALKGATAIFGGGIAHMIDDIIPGSYSILNSLLVLTYSAFCLTSLDTATRLARFMFQEFWLEPGETAADIKEGWKKVMVNPYFATILTVVLGILLGMNGYGKIWGLFGAANQLLAGIGLLAVATWLGNMGKNNKMFLIPMAFMIIVTITSLALTVKNQIGMIAAGGADWGPWAQTILGILLIFLAIILVIEGVQTLSRQKAAKA